MASREKRPSFKIGDEGAVVGTLRRDTTTNWIFFSSLKKLLKYSNIFANRERNESRRQELMVINK